MDEAATATSTATTEEVEKKREMCRHIKQISLQQCEKELQQLKDHARSPLLRDGSLVGNNVVDYFTFMQRLETKGKYGLSFFDFVDRIDEFRQKQFIQTMLTYYETTKNKKGHKHIYKVYKEVYNICISAINIMKPLNMVDIYSRFRGIGGGGLRVLHFCCGWGGGLVAAAVSPFVESYVGIECNLSLQLPYKEMLAFLQPAGGVERKRLDILFGDAVTMDVTAAAVGPYTMAFSSPPYYFLERYENAPVQYTDKKDMNTRFYTPLFSRTYAGLTPGGVYVINVCVEVYTTVLIPLLGEAHEIFPLKKSKRQNNYMELVYVWRKPLAPPHI